MLAYKIRVYVVPQKSCLEAGEPGKPVAGQTKEVEISKQEGPVIHLRP